MSLGSALFIIASPFQGVCMLEAIKHYNIDNYDVIIAYSDKYSIYKIKELLDNRKIKYAEQECRHLLYDTLHLIRNYKRKKYDNVFLGDCFARFETFAYIYLKFRGQLYYLDDGNATITRFTNPKYRHPTSIGVRVFLFLSKIYAQVKIIRRPIYFSIFDDEVGRFNVEHNAFRNLIGDTHISQKNVYIIGTNSAQIQFKNNSYYKLLTQLRDYCKENYVQSKVYYCPHRRNADVENVISHCKNIGFEIFNTQTSVEVDFIESKISPKAIIGFNSTALYTLHIIYPKSDVLNVKFKISDEELEQMHNEIRGVYEKKGIRIIEME